MKRSLPVLAFFLLLFFVFRAPAAADPASAPVVDRYGQLIASSFPGKILRDSDLDLGAVAEIARLKEIGVPDRFDSYGGRTDLGWHASASGFFRLMRRDGCWWLITPEGNPCFYIGVSTAPATDWDGTPVTGRREMFSGLPESSGQFAPAWKTDMWSEGAGSLYFSFRIANLIRRFGPDWAMREDELSARRLKTFGFSGVAKWGGVSGLPAIPVLHIDPPMSSRRYDVFDESARKRIHDSLLAQILPHLRDPDIVGWSIGNESEEIISPDEIADILAANAQSPAKQALVNYALQRIYGGDIARLASSWQVAATSTADILASVDCQPPAEDAEALREFYADRYYACLYDTVKSIDPNHLYFGSWILPGAWIGSSDWYLMASHADALGYDCYSAQFAPADLNVLLSSIGKPVFCGEFSFPPDYDGSRGFGRFVTSVETEDAAGQAYEQWMKEAAQSPYVIGAGWFQYIDEPVSGRGPGQGADAVYGENYAFGLYTQQDQPHWTLLSYMRRANLAAAPLHNALSSQAQAAGGKH